MYVYVQQIPNWISYSYGGLFSLGYYILNLRIFEILSDSATLDQQLWRRRKRLQADISTLLEASALFRVATVKRLPMSQAASHKKYLASSDISNTHTQLIISHTTHREWHMTEFWISLLPRAGDAPIEPPGRRACLRCVLIHPARSLARHSSSRMSASIQCTPRGPHQRVEEPSLRGI